MWHRLKIAQYLVADIMDCSMVLTESRSPEHVVEGRLTGDTDFSEEHLEDLIKQGKLVGWDANDNCPQWNEGISHTQVRIDGKLYRLSINNVERLVMLYRLTD